MNEKPKNALSVVMGLILLLLIGTIAIWLLFQLADWHNNLDSSLQTGIVTAIPIILVAVIGYFANKSLETKRSVEQAIRPKKLELYTEFNAFFMRIFANEKVGKAPSETEIMKFFAKKTPELITFASNSVIEKWGKLRVGLESTTANEQKMFLVEDLLKEIRADLGHNKRGFSRGDILRLFVNDIDDHLKGVNKQKPESKTWTKL